jgi:integrase
MRERHGRGRVHGPYRDGAGWRVVVIPADGARAARYFQSQGKAARFAADCRAELDAKDATVTAAVDLYLASRDLKPDSIKTSRYRLAALFAGLEDVYVGDLTPQRCQAAYDQLVARQAGDTHRNTLALGKAFLKWAAKTGYADSNAMEDVEPTGKRKVGKEQLRIDEARKLIRLATEMAAAGDQGALATMTILLLGIRASECASIVARDIDDDGRLLWIPKSKTAAGVRRLALPPGLGELLLAAADGAGVVFRRRGGVQADRYWIGHHVERLCRLAGVPVVPPHGLRGTHASLAVRSGASSEVVAESLGHTSVRITERHYTREDATLEARATRVAKALKGR